MVLVTLSTIFQSYKNLLLNYEARVRLLAIFALLFHDIKVLSEEILWKDLYIDAEQTEFNSMTGKEVFEGDVVAISENFVLAANKIVLDRREKTIVAEGKVFLLGERQVLLCDSMKLWQSSGLLEMRDVIVVVDDPSLSKKYIEQIIGNHEKDKTNAIDLENHKNAVREKKFTIKNKYRFAKDSEKFSLEKEYQILLERSDKLKNATGRQIDQEEGKRNFIFRRNIWKQYGGTGPKNKILNLVEHKTYFKIRANELERIDPFVFKASNAHFTVCKCSEGESPAWSLFSSKVTAETGEYADLQDSIFKIKGIPVFYLPFVRLPLKHQRQTGLLSPSYSWSTSTGSVLKQPFYFAVKDNQDVTFNVESFQRRGIRLSGEYRYKSTQQSSWTLNTDVVRDHQWLEEIIGNRI